MQYCESIFKTVRWPTREVQVGNVGIGGNHPVRIQSMTTSDTRDVEATVGQIIRLADAGCDMVRLTVQGNKEAEACEAIKNSLVQQGCTIPLIADIHFYPPAALRVADFVEKVRINPGNFADRRASFKQLEYTDESYAAELQRVEEKFTPLVEKCKRLNRAIRIGTNHGSLSDRIMNRYGDSPRGMVESAFEFARICRKNDFHNFLFSMKSSNPKVMIHAYRLLVAEMRELGWNYPLHLGVTEAGDGEDGRVKSAMGIGALLLDGLGDTVRVSLTEDPWHEVDPCRQIVKFGKAYQHRGTDPFTENHRNFEEIARRKVIVPSFLHRDGTVLTSQAELPNLSDLGALSSADRFSQTEQESTVRVSTESPTLWPAIKEARPSAILLAFRENRLHQSRAFFEWMEKENLSIPVILDFDYQEDAVIRAAAEMGALLCDGLGEGVLIDRPNGEQLGYTILQAARMRRTKTEYISCPSCGRTLFNLQEVTQKIRARTNHLPGVAIAIMGCIVNGPGEMADADFGFVGSKTGMVDLYVGRECVQRNIPFEGADERLIELIKEHGRWIEPALQPAGAVSS